MNTQIVLVLVFLLGIIDLGYSQGQQNATNLLCYDCDPQRDAEQCINPVENGVQQTNCDQKFIDRSPNSTLICLSANITYYGYAANNTGLYRGCYVQDASVVSFCDWFKQETESQNAVLVSCVPCNTTRCNGVTFDSLGQPNSSPTLFNLVITVTIVCFIFSLLF